MKVGIMQPYFFPYIGYWQLINAVDKFVIYDDVNYIKGGWINRNNILLNGEKHLITLPLEGASSFSLINTIHVTSNTKQKEKILKTIESAYKKASFFEQIYPIIRATVLNNDLNISKVLAYSIKSILEYLDINTEVLLSSEINKNNSLKSEEKVINIVKILNGTQYINAIGGQNLYNKKNFAYNGIDLKFIKTKNIAYKQFNNEFIPNLSIIDVMMFNSPDKIREMLNDYELL